MAAQRKKRKITKNTNDYPRTKVRIFSSLRRRRGGVSYSKLDTKGFLSKNLYFYVVLVVLFAGLLFYKTLKVRYWDSEIKTHIIYPDEKGDVQFLIIDPTANELTTISIPGETEVEVARQLGVIRLKNVWKLGEQDGFGGRLLAETTTKSLRFPVFIWAESNANDLSNLNIFSFFKFVFTPMDTNLSFGDKIKIGVFALNIGQSNVRQIELTDYAYLQKTNLIDGDSGYIISNKIPIKLAAFISYPLISNQAQAYSIVNQTGDFAIAEKLGDVISVIGAKVAAVKREDESNIDCIVTGKNEKAQELTAKIFTCKIENNDIENNLDVQITIGKKFLERF